MQLTRTLVLQQQKTSISVDMAARTGHSTPGSLSARKWRPENFATKPSPGLGLQAESQAAGMPHMYTHRQGVITGHWAVTEYASICMNEGRTRSTRDSCRIYFPQQTVSLPPNTSPIPTLLHRALQPHLTVAAAQTAAAAAARTARCQDPACPHRMGMCLHTGGTCAAESTRAGGCRVQQQSSSTSSTTARKTE